MFQFVLAIDPSIFFSFYFYFLRQENGQSLLNSESFLELAIRISEVISNRWWNGAVVTVKFVKIDEVSIIATVG